MGWANQYLGQLPLSVNSGMSTGCAKSHGCEQLCISLARFNTHTYRDAWFQLYFVTLASKWNVFVLKKTLTNINILSYFCWCVLKCIWFLESDVHTYAINMIISSDGESCWHFCVYLCGDGLHTKGNMTPTLIIDNSIDGFGCISYFNRWEGRESESKKDKRLTKNFREMCVKFFGKWRLISVIFLFLLVAFFVICMQLNVKWDVRIFVRQYRTQSEELHQYWPSQWYRCLHMYYINKLRWPHTNIIGTVGVKKKKDWTDLR